MQWGNIFKPVLVTEGVNIDGRRSAKILKMGCELARLSGISRPLPADQITPILPLPIKNIYTSTY